MSEEAKPVEAKPVEVKPWWKSVSLWLTVLTIVGLSLAEAVAAGLLPTGGWVAIAIMVIGLVTKRGLTENEAIKANANGGPKPPDPLRP